MKEKLQDITVEAKVEVHNISGTAKETTSNALDLAKGNIYDGIGRSKAPIVDNVQLKKVINGGDSMDTLKKTTSNVNDNVDEIDKNANAQMKNDANNVINPAEQFYDDVKNKANNYYHEEDQSVRNIIDSRNTIQDHYSNIEQHYRDIRDYYDRPSDDYKNKGGKQYQKNVNDAFRSYYHNTKGVVENSNNDIKDKTKDEFKDGKNRRNYYNNIRQNINGPIPNQHEERSRSYHLLGRQKSAHGFRNAHDMVEDYYDNTNFIPEKDHLEAIVESMGWRRIGIVPLNHVSTSIHGELMIGNVKYAWHGKDQSSSQENPQNHMPNKDVIDNKSPSKGYPHWLDHQLSNVEYEDDSNNKDDDYNYKKSQTLKERIQNLHNTHESEEFEEEEYVDLSQEEFYENDEETTKRSQDVCLWKEVFFKKPKGFLLTLIRALHFFTFSIIYGSSFWMTFVSGIVLSKHIPRQQFGYVQSRMFPIYLRILAIGESTLFILQFFMHPWFSASSGERCQLSNFGLMILSTLINAYVLEPQATKVCISLYFIHHCIFAIFYSIYIHVK